MYSQADVDSLKAALASGVRSVSFTGPPARTVVYSSTAELVQAIAIAEDAVRMAAATKTRYRFGATRKGL